MDHNQANWVIWLLAGIAFLQFVQCLSLNWLVRIYHRLDRLPRSDRRVD